MNILIYNLEQSFQLLFIYQKKKICFGIFSIRYELAINSTLMGLQKNLINLLFKILTKRAFLFYF